MSTNIFRFIGRPLWDGEIAENTEMFFAADRMDEAAYEVLETGDKSAEVWARFSELKQIADAQRTAAYQDWMRIKRQMMK